MVLFELLDVADLNPFDSKVFPSQILLKVRHKVLKAYVSVIAFTTSDECVWLLLTFEADCS